MSVFELAIFIPDLPLHPLQPHMLLLQEFKFGLGRVGMRLERVMQGAILGVVLLELLGLVPELLPLEL